MTREFALVDKDSLYAVSTPTYIEHVQMRFIHTAEVAVELSEELSRGNAIKKITGAKYQDLQGYDRKDPMFRDNKSYGKVGAFTDISNFNAKKIAAAHTVGVGIELRRKNDDINGLLGRTEMQPHHKNSHGPERVIDKVQAKFFKNFDNEKFREDPRKYFYEKMMEPALEALRDKQVKGRNSGIKSYQADFDDAIRAIESLLQRQPTKIEKFEDPYLATAPHVQLFQSLPDLEVSTEPRDNLFDIRNRSHQEEIMLKEQKKRIRCEQEEEQVLEEDGFMSQGKTKNKKFKQEDEQDKMEEEEAEELEDMIFA